jgi:hypothetical protein
VVAEAEQESEAAASAPEPGASGEEGAENVSDAASDLAGESTETTEE